MPKPWELDWSSGAPAPDAMPLPIVPFFGRQRPPMLADAGVGMDTGLMPSAYRMISTDPSTLLAPGPSQMAGADPSVIQATGQFPMPVSDWRATPVAGSSLPMQTDVLAPHLAPSAFGAAQPFQSAHSASAARPSTLDPMPVVTAAEGQPYLQSATSNGWRAMVSPDADSTLAQSSSLPQTLTAQRAAPPGPPIDRRSSTEINRVQVPARTGQSPAAGPRPASGAPAYPRGRAAPALQPVPGLYDAHGTVNRDILGERIETVGERSHQWQVSSAGAIGVMQLTLDTARETARRLGAALDENRLRHDEVYNRTIGRARVNHLLDRYHGDPVLAAAAYNAGTGRVHQWIARYGDPSHGEISDAEFARRIPNGQTHAYVQRVVYGQTPAQQRTHRHRHR